MRLYQGHSCVPRKPTNRAVAFWRHHDLPGLELRTSSFTNRAFREHLHTVYSIGLIDRGATVSTLWGEPYEARAGDIVVLEPYAVHACNPVAGREFAYRMFFVDADWLCERTTDSPAFAAPVVRDPALFDTLSALFSDIVDAAEPARLGGRIRADLLQLATRHGATRTHESRQHLIADWMMSSMAQLEGDLGRAWDVGDLARVAGVSRAHFSRRFKAAAGLSPYAYLNLLRIEQAKRLLAAGAPIADTALEVGFVDQSHFARTFRRFSGATPAQYRAATR